MMRKTFRKPLALLFLLALSLGLCGLAAAGPAYEYTQEDLFVEASDGHLIPATLTLPIGSEGETFPAVIMLHGNGSNRHEAGNSYDVAAPMMAQAGIATIRFDFMGNGDSTEDYINFSKDVGVAEAMECYHYIAALPAIDTDRIGIMGWSMGGGITLLTAARNDVFASVVTWAGSAGEGGVDEERYAIAKEQGHFLVEYGWREPLKVGLASFEVDLKTNTLAEIPAINAPILATVGMEDDVVPSEIALSIVEASSHADSMVLMLKAVDHTYNSLGGDYSAIEKVTRATIHWFLDTM